jgi:hypothetical protein
LVNQKVFPGKIVLTSVELEESAAMAPMARAEREATMKEARILMVLICVVEKILLGEKMFMEMCRGGERGRKRKSRRAKRASAGY